MTIRNKLVAGTTAMTALLASSAAAYPASNLRDLVGANAGQAERQLEMRGFTYIDGHKQGSSSFTYWWHDKDDNCVAVETMGGQYVTINDATRKDCNRSGGGDTAAALGVAAGAVLIGALLSSGHKKHHHEDDNHLSDADAEAHYERGYQDGLHNVPYHNNGRDEAYASGYRAGVDQRASNTSHHTGRGGYSSAASWQDLVGARANAIDQLGNRGFRQVDNFVSGTARYSIWWRGDSRQCLQVITADGRLENITDIGQHPKCR